MVYCIERVAKHKPGPVEERLFAEYNHSVIAHPLTRAIPQLGWFLNMPEEPVPGDAYMPRVSRKWGGASERFAVSPGKEAEGFMHMPGGQSGHPMSTYYRAGHSAWVRGEEPPFLPGPVQHELLLKP